MGGPKRDPNDYIFKKLIPKPKVTDSTPKNIAPPWIDLEELAFGKPQVSKNPKVPK